MAGAKHRIKGARVERELRQLHLAIGVPAERVPLSGAARYQGNGEDLDIVFDNLTLHCQVKAMSTPRGLKGVLDTLGNADVLFYRFDRQPGEPHPRPPLVILPWRIWEKIANLITLVR